MPAADQAEHEQVEELEFGREWNNFLDLSQKRDKYKNTTYSSPTPYLLLEYSLEALRLNQCSENQDFVLAGWYKLVTVVE